MTARPTSELPELPEPCSFQYRREGGSKWEVLNAASDIEKARRMVGEGLMPAECLRGLHSDEAMHAYALAAIAQRGSEGAWQLVPTKLDEGMRIAMAASPKVAWHGTENGDTPAAYQQRVQDELWAGLLAAAPAGGEADGPVDSNGDPVSDWERPGT